MLDRILKIWMVLFFACLMFILLPSLRAEEEKYSFKQGKRDPFVPLISPAGFLLNLEPDDKSALRLEGIMYDPNGDSVAIIDGELVRVGEAIGDSVLVSVEPEKIIVIKDNQKVEMMLRREE